MGTVEDLRKVLQDFLAPELRAVEVRFDALDQRIDGLTKIMDSRFDSFLSRFDSVDTKFASMSRDINSHQPSHFS